ncbi:MAG: acyltransferase [Planctomycetota bacterium]
MDVLPIRNESRPPAKLLGLDWLRAVAALGVVLLHACVPYARHPMPGLAWPVKGSGSGWVDVVFWSIELFVMPLFLVIAGFLAMQGLARRSGGQFIRHRARRLLIPLLFGVVVVLPIDLHLWVLGWVVDGKVAISKLRSFKFDGQIDQHLWGLSHLWFLQYLFSYLCLLVTATWTAQTGVLQKLRLPKLSLQRLTLALVCLGSIVLYVRPEVVWGFQHSYWPVPSKWIYSGLFFAFGAVLAKWDADLSWLTHFAFRAWPVAACATVGAICLGQWHLSGGENQYANALLAVLTCGSATLLTCVMMGLAHSSVRSVPTSIQYLSAGSFWLYIVHHPVLALIHIDQQLITSHWVPIINVFTSFTLAVGVSMLTYEGLVRRSWLGRWLGFQWQIPSKSESVVSIRSESFQQYDELNGQSIKRAA